MSRRRLVNISLNSTRSCFVLSLSLSESTLSLHSNAFRKVFLSSFFESG